MYNSDNEEFVYQSKKFEDVIKSGDNLAQQLEDESNLLKQ